MNQEDIKHLWVGDLVLCTDVQPSDGGGDPSRHFTVGKFYVMLQASDDTIWLEACDKGYCEICRSSGWMISRFQVVPTLEESINAISMSDFDAFSRLAEINFKTAV